MRQEEIDAIKLGVDPYDNVPREEGWYLVNLLGTSIKYPVVLHYEDVDGTGLDLFASWLNWDGSLRKVRASSLIGRVFESLAMRGER